MHVSTLFLLALLGWLAVHRWLPRWRWLKRALLLLAAPLALLIYPFTNNLLAHWIESGIGLDRPCLDVPPAAIVVLPAGLRWQPRGSGPWSRFSPVSVVRILEGVSLARRHSGATLIFAGSKAEAVNFKRGLAAIGAFEPGRVLIDERSYSTDLAARRVAALLGERGIDSAWLVTSALHMPRALRALQRQGVAVCPDAVDYSALPSPRPWWIFPPPQALERADKLAHEMLGLTWYWVTDRI